MKRWHEEEHIAKRHLKEYQRIRPNLCKNQLGRFRKMDGYDCGNSKCCVCHSDKFYDRPDTYQEFNSKLKYKEGLEDI